MSEISKFLQPLDRKRIYVVHYLNGSREKKIFCVRIIFVFSLKMVSIATKQLKTMITKETCAKPILAAVEESSVADFSEDRSKKCLLSELEQDQNNVAHMLIRYKCIIVLLQQ